MEQPLKIQRQIATFFIYSSVLFQLPCFLPYSFPVLQVIEWCIKVNSKPSLLYSTLHLACPHQNIISTHSTLKQKTDGSFVSDYITYLRATYEHQTVHWYGILNCAMTVETGSRSVGASTTCRWRSRMRSQKSETRLLGEEEIPIRM
jgi:hypothetical protein